MGYLGTRKNGAGLSRSRRSVEEEVGQLVVLDEGSDGVDDVLVRDQLIQGIGPILLNPGQVHTTGLAFFCHPYFRDMLILRAKQMQEGPFRHLTMSCIFIFY